MGIIDLLDKFVSWAVGIIPKLINANENLRQEVRDSVGQVADELNRGLELVAIRLTGAKYIQDQREIATYLRESRQKLIEYHSEFKICKGLRDIRARFNSLFSSPKRAIRVEKVEEVENLLAELELDERMLFDELGALWPKLEQAADNLVMDYKRPELIRFLTMEIEAVHSRQDRIRKLARDVLSQM